MDRAVSRRCCRRHCCEASGGHERNCSCGKINLGHVQAARHLLRRPSSLLLPIRSQREEGRRLSGSYDALVEAVGSKASGEITVDRFRFDKLTAELQRYAEALSTAAKNNPVSMDEMFMKAGEGMGGGPFGTGRSELSSNVSAEHSFHLMLQTCAACHQRFRTNSPYLDR